MCAYYGIATGDNSFGYIASWSKDKTLPELRESLEVISRTADGFISDIDRHYAEILKEREAELIAAEPAMAVERLYTVDKQYLHVQRTETGVDYTIYDKASMKKLDSGQMDMEISTLAEAALEICKSHEIGQNAPLQVADIGILDELQAAQDAAIAIEPPVQENPETDIPPDPAISVEARNAYGYTDDAMLPLTKERAMELFERDVPVYLLYGDNTEAMAFGQTEILNHDGIFGIDRADWEAVKEQFPVVAENRWQKAFQQNPADSYCIYQLRRDPELAELRFMNSHYLREHGIEPAFDHYEAVYSGSLPSDGSTEARLDDLYMKFNTAHPQDFTGHSLSVSDIVVLRQQGVVRSHYVDSVGFVQLPAFLPDNYLKNAEISMEDDYGMIDGIINNGPKEQPEVKPKAPDLSALFEAARQVVQEDIVGRHNIRNKAELEELLNILSSAIGSLTNPEKLSATFRSVKNKKISSATIRKYIDYLCDSFLIDSAVRYDVKGKKYIDTPVKYYFTDMGLRNARLNFRQLEETHSMENIIFNELKIRGFNVDVGVIIQYDTNEKGNSVRRQLEIDFVCNKGSKRYYIQSAYAIPDQAKMEQEQRSLMLTGDFFKRIIITKDTPAPYYNENGVLIMSVYDFLLNENSLDI